MDVWEEIISWRSSSLCTRKDHHFHATLTRELEIVRDDLELKTAPNMVSMYNPRVVALLKSDVYLERFVRFFPTLLHVETDAPAWSGPRLLRHFTREYQLNFLLNFFMQMRRTPNHDLQHYVQKKSTGKPWFLF